jgi:hypothetical protein
MIENTNGLMAGDPLIFGGQVTAQIPNMRRTASSGPPVEPGLVRFHYFSGMGSLSQVVSKAR